MSYQETIDEIFGAENTEKVVYRSSIVSLFECLVFCSGIGVFAGFWQLYIHYYNRRNNIKVTISYISKNNNQVAVEIDKLSEDKFKQVLEAYPPLEDQNVKVSIEPAAGTGKES